MSLVTGSIDFTARILLIHSFLGVTQVRSITRFGLSQVTTVFEDDTDIYKVRHLVSQRLQGIADRLPKNAHAELGPVSSGLGEIYHYYVKVEKPAEGEM